MRRSRRKFLLFALLLAAVPSVPALFSHYSDNSSSPSSSAPSPSSAAPLPDNSESIRLLDVSTGDVITLPMTDYIIGAVTAEMPASFDPDALKAQAVAVHTYAVRRQNAEKNNPTPELCGADLSNDPSAYQAYFTESQALEFYGSGYDAASQKISDAVLEVKDYILTYEDEPILAAFCSMSSGQTESAADVWGQDVPYLVPADSSGDLNAPNFLAKTEFSDEELRKLLQAAFPDGDFSGKPDELIKIESVSDSGSVQNVSAGGLSLRGIQIREALNLRSAAFEIEHYDGKFIFTTKGFGHGVGMSQYGADAMAKAGADWQEILLHYYKGAELSVLP